MSELISIPAAAPTRLTAEAFWDRFTANELADYDIASQHTPFKLVAGVLTDETTPNMRRQARLRIFKHQIDHDGFFDLSNPKRTAKVSGLLVTEAILTAGRANTILTTPIAPDEAA